MVAIEKMNYRDSVWQSGPKPFWYQYSILTFGNIMIHELSHVICIMKKPTSMFTIVKLKNKHTKIRQSHHAFEIMDKVHSLLIAQNMIKKYKSRQVWFSMYKCHESRIPYGAVQLFKCIYYHPDELRDSITGRSVWSTALFQRCANSARDLLPNIGSLICRILKAQTIRIYILQARTSLFHRTFILCYACYR